MSIWTFILIIFIIFISQALTYKIIKIIDKKERKKLYNWELQYIKQLQVENSKLKKEQKEKTKNADTSDNNSSDDSTNVLESNKSRTDNLQATQ